MPDPRFRVTSDPLDVSAVSAIVSSADCGAIATFVGLVRDENGGRRVLWLDYEAYEPLAVKSFARIDEEAGERWPPIGLAIHHRVGGLEIGEAGLVIAAASRHRVESCVVLCVCLVWLVFCFPIWKHEHFEGG